MDGHDDRCMDRHCHYYWELASLLGWVELLPYMHHPRRPVDTSSPCRHSWPSVHTAPPGHTKWSPTKGDNLFTVLKSSL